MSTRNSNFDVVAMRDSTLRELERLIAERRDLDKRISGLRVALNGFNATIRAQRNENALEPPPLDAEYQGIRDLGLTDAIRRVLENATGGMTPKDVRAKLESLEYKQLPTNNPLAAIHGVFTRLEKAGEIEPTQPDRKAFRWIPPIERGIDGLLRDRAYSAATNVLQGTPIFGVGSASQNTVTTELKKKK